MGIYLRIRRARVLRDIELHLPGAGTILVLGPNGAGKTTLLKAIAGVVRAEAEIEVNGVRLDRLPPSRRRVGYVPQGLALFNHLTVYDNIAYGLRARGLPEHLVEERVVETARRLGVLHLLDRMPWQLSGGEKQRVALARALVIDARILLLDEAFDHIDEAARKDLMRLIALESGKKRIPIILVTHHPREALESMNVVAIVRLRNGRLESVEELEDAVRPSLSRALALAG